MAEIQMNARHRSPGVKKISKKSTKVDLTPMVDLGFLLLTFFVFTTTLSQSRALSVSVPKDTAPINSTPVCNSCVLTIVPTDNNKIIYFEGAAENKPAIKITSYSPGGIRDIILAKNKGVMALNDPLKQFVLAIKPGDKSNYQNFVDILDEVAINNVEHYFIARPDEFDKKLLPGLWE